MRVDDADLAAAVEPALGPLGVIVEQAAQLPAFEAVYGSFAEQMGSDAEAAPPEPFAWDIDSALVEPLFKAAARYARRAPWDLLLDHPPLALEGLNGFISKHRTTIETSTALPGTLAHTTRMGEGRDRRPVTVTAPAPGFAWEDEAGVPLEPPPGAATTLYRFQVKLDWRKRVWRRIELRGDQTLHDLHGAIQAAFDWDDDHLYAFFLSGEAWDEASEYTSPYGENGRNATRYPLAGLPLQEGQRFLYIFDFGDELRHLVTLEAVVPGGVEPDAACPRIVESHGDAPPQYG